MVFAGRYALMRMLGRGGMGTVYQARDKLVGDVVALKTLELGKYASPDALERFSREVRLARRITHPHVARMHDLGTHEGQAFLTMEYVEGEDLRALLARERTLPAARAAHIALAAGQRPRRSRWPCGADGLRHRPRGGGGGDGADPGRRGHASVHGAGAGVR